MVAFIDEHRSRYGVEPICRVLPIAPSTYFKHKAEQRDPARRSVRAQDDDELRAIILRIWNEHRQVYGSAKCGARCTMSRPDPRADAHRARLPQRRRR
jgi:hypothetical protein